MLNHVKSGMLVSRTFSTDGSSEPGRSESDADDLDKEAFEVERVVMKQDPSAISDQFRSDTCQDDRRKEPGSILEPYREVDEEGNDIECNEDRVGCDCGSINGRRRTWRRSNKVLVSACSLRICH